MEVIPYFGYMLARSLSEKRRQEPLAGKRNGSPTITETAYWALKRAILQGRFPEGAFLSEADVTREFRIGRTPFREACNRLHHEELLEAVPRRGYMVRKMSFRQVRDFFELRLFVESTVAELAAVRATPDQVSQLEKLACPPLAAETREQQMEELTEANKRFHLYIASTTANEELLKLMTQMMERSARISYIELSSGRFHQPDLERYHRPIVEAIRRRDSLAAREAVVADITNAQMSTLGHGFWQNRSGGSIAGTFGAPAAV
jgi:DNA-binding GntR family transcriptional regulator